MKEDILSRILYFIAGFLLCLAAIKLEKVTISDRQKQCEDLGGTYTSYIPDVSENMTKCTLQEEKVVKLK